MDAVKKINEILVSIFNSVLKMEEMALQGSTRINLSITEIHTLEAIGTGKPKTMTQVAGALKISVGTLTVAISKLVKKGYVERSRVSEDRRIVKIWLTETGKDTVDEHLKFHEAMVRDAISDLSEEDTIRFTKSIENINQFFLMQKNKPLKSKELLELKTINLGNLIIPVPIFQGGMGVGISMAKLAGAVANCGGVGVISVAQAGFGESDFEKSSIEANVRALKANIKEALASVAGNSKAGPIGVNVMVALNHYQEYVTASIEAGAQIIISGAGLPTGLPGISKADKVKLIPIVSSARATGLIIKSWMKKHNRVPDAIIFEGPLAGGHLGFKEEQLDLAQENFYKTITEIKAELQELPNCPLIVGGGIFTREDALKAISYGADGVQLGTRFVTTEECDAPMEFKQAYINCKEQDIAIIKSPVGMPGRAIKNEFAKRIIDEGKKEPIKKCNGCILPCNPAEAPYCITEALIKSAKGDVKDGLVFCGANAYKCDKIERVEDIFKEFMAGN
jgi:NAD(P)H-dependent flavin oxidoreductase YrpB (nitropropane dioxygenase family)/DNA-binding MarR family transcriptional regulator